MSATPNPWEPNEVETAAIVELTEFARVMIEGSGSPQIVAETAAVYRDTHPETGAPTMTMFFGWTEKGEKKGARFTLESVPKPREDKAKKGEAADLGAFLIGTVCVAKTMTKAGEIVWWSEGDGGLRP